MKTKKPINMKETSKLIDIIKDIEITIISKIYADLIYRHDGFGRPTSYNHLARFHKELSSLPSMVKAKEEHDRIEKDWIAANPDYEFCPIFRTIEEMKEKGKEIFNEQIKEKEGKNLE
jgi:hypothetical protein